MCQLTCICKSMFVYRLLISSLRLIEIIKNCPNNLIFSEIFEIEIFFVMMYLLYKKEHRIFILLTRLYSITL